MYFELEKAKFNTTDCVCFMPNTEDILVLTFAQIIKTKRDGDYHQRCLHLVVQEDDRVMLLSMTAQ